MGADIVRNEDAEFIDQFDFQNKDKVDLLDIIRAANYMDIKSLVNLGCAKVALLVKKFETGQEVLADWRGKGKWYNAVITNIEADGKFAIHYEEEEKKETVTSDTIRALTSCCKTRKDIARLLFKE